jgi:hypothetical protein
MRDFRDPHHWERNIIVMRGKKLGMFVSNKRDTKKRMPQASTQACTASEYKTSIAEETDKDRKRGTHSAVTAASNSDSGSLSSAEPRLALCLPPCLPPAPPLAAALAVDEGEAVESRAARRTRPRVIMFVLLAPE